MAHLKAEAAAAFAAGDKATAVCRLSPLTSHRHHLSSLLSQVSRLEAAIAVDPYDDTLIESLRAVHAAAPPVGFGRTGALQHRSSTSICHIYNDIRCLYY